MTETKAQRLRENNFSEVIEEIITTNAGHFTGNDKIEAKVYTKGYGEVTFTIDVPESAYRESVH